MSYTAEQLWSFWNNVMDKLTSTELYSPVPDALRDCCDFFGFGCGFIYMADHTGIFSLKEKYAVYKNDTLPHFADLKILLGKPLFEELLCRKFLFITVTSKKSPLEQKLCELFGANSMIFIPIKDDNDNLIASMGVVDRRGECRLEEKDRDFAFSLLFVIAKNIKLLHYKLSVERAHNSLKTIMDNMGVEICISDFFTKEILYANNSLMKAYNLSDEIIGKNSDDVFVDCSNEQEPWYLPKACLIDENENLKEPFSWDYYRKFDDSWKRMVSCALPWTDGRLAHVVSSVDITENKVNEVLIEKLAYYDMLTQLPNRRMLLDDFSEIKKLNDDGYVVFMDLDGFKVINDKLGHKYGDELLMSVGNIIDSIPYPNSKGYRFGGDEFVLLCNEANPENLRNIIDFIIENFRDELTFEFGGEIISCRCSIGICKYTTDSYELEELLHFADKAMYYSKEQGKNRIYYYDGKSFTEFTTYIR